MISKRSLTGVLLRLVACKHSIQTCNIPQPPVLLETTWQTVDVSNVERTLTVEMKLLLVLSALREKFQPPDLLQSMTVRMVIYSIIFDLWKEIVLNLFNSNVEFIENYLNIHHSLLYSSLFCGRLHDRQWMSAMWSEHFQWRWSFFLY